MKKRRMLGACGAALLGLLVSLSAEQAEAAGVTQSLAVNACDVSGPQAVYDWNGIYNPSTTEAMQFNCTVPQTGNVYNANLVTVWATDPGPGMVACQLRTLDGWGTVVFSGADKFTQGVGQQFMNWTSVTGGLVHVRCAASSATSSSPSARHGLNGIYITEL